MRKSLLLIILAILLVASPSWAAGLGPMILGGGVVAAGGGASCPADGSPDINITGPDTLGLFTLDDRGYGGGIYYNTTAEKNICKLGFYLLSIGGNISGKTYTMKIWQLAAPNSALPANPITNGTSATISGATMAAGNWYYFSFSGNPTVAQSTNYAFTIDQGGGDESNNINSNCNAEADSSPFIAVNRWAWDDKANTLYIDPGFMSIKVYYYD